ncbi:MAG: RnfABCDGE type electron transport complex subunit G [Lachnospiraceae bacterium]
MNKIIKDTITITIITLISGICLGLVYQITKDPIKASEKATQQAAYEAVFTKADSFENYKEFDAKEAQKLLAKNNLKEDKIDSVVVAQDAAGEVLGYVVSVTSSAGYGGDISFSVGIALDGTINGYKILAISETAGLGMKAAEEKFKSQFDNVNTTEFSVTKSAAASDNEIEAISGATITSKAVTYGVNAAIVYFNSIVEGGSINE